MSPFIGYVSLMYVLSHIPVVTRLGPSCYLLTRHSYLGEGGEPDRIVLRFCHDILRITSYSMWLCRSSKSD